MRKDYGLLIAIAGLSIGGFLFYLYNSKKRPIKGKIDAENIPVKKIDGVVRLEDVANYFRNLSLDSDVDTPFIVRCSRLHEVIESFNNDTDDDSVFLGVFKEGSDVISNYIIFAGAAFDKKLSDVLSKATNDNPIIVLN